VLDNPPFLAFCISSAAVFLAIGFNRRN
jgi:hypothetical protein